MKTMKIPWFDKQTFVVTGGSSGIGFAISQKLAQEGAKVIAVSYNPTEFSIAQSKLDADQQNIEFFKCDITNSEDRESLKQFISSRERSLAGIINAAGITTYGPFLKTPISALKKLYDINFTGTILFTRDILPLVLNDQTTDLKYLGFISSTSGIAAMPYFGGYPATKAGVEMFLRCMELEYPKNVKILSIRPGPVRTNLYNNVTTAPDYNIKRLLDSRFQLKVLPEVVASAFVRAIKKKKHGIIYPKFGTKISARFMKRKMIAKLMMKGMEYMNTMDKSRTV
ncbi:SDR family NAD(P)-dependent oxidoreductase [Promethearchaeum syntrophicum]|uniref:SDR family NAD(P)-dependent oxidoreductase n=1 Tax=Promethearchaeum syntrophicum TaxID=2594042 RepID=A0A5B9D657_9ARCH|nr:SDR family oxidoreductase [Candidatus Prometheoarchaeum syntrophicum]QEE14466.1 short chain dehydrogenase [Candidatus Prometheoarchaeum syntrophicum]